MLSEPEPLCPEDAPPTAAELVEPEEPQADNKHAITTIVNTNAFNFTLNHPPISKIKKRYNNCYLNYCSAFYIL